MSDIKLNYSGSTGDLDLTGKRVSLATGEEAIEAQVMIRFRFFLEEWFLDRRLGIPYFRDALIKNPNLDLVRSLLRSAIIETPGISAVTNLDLTLNAQQRELSVNFSATMDTGEALTFSPFIIEV